MGANCVNGTFFKEVRNTFFREHVTNKFYMLKIESIAVAGFYNLRTLFENG